ncbi:MAG: hypothetical protein HYX53_10120 [Chloroflexi bacterium]|nr:hypothetical protein [Chloroflexota bacterium]
MLRKFLRRTQPRALLPTASRPEVAAVLHGRSLGEYQFAALDLETTGLFPQAHDRVVEVGIVLFTLDGGIQDEYETLVNPSRDLGAQHIHGLSMADLAHAPPFADVSPDVVAALRDRVVVAHNSRFDVGFLAAEFQHAGIDTPELPHLCTMRLAASERLGRRLPEICASIGVQHIDSHTAIGDARAVAAVMTRWYRAQSAQASLTLRSCGCSCEPRPDLWPTLSTSERAVVRSEASRLAALERDYLSRLVSALPMETGSVSPNEAGYLDLLERALDDRYLSLEEARELAAFAESDGLSTATVRGLHRQLFESLTNVAWHDGVVSSIEAADLRLVGQFLGLPESLIEVAIKQAPDLRPLESGEREGGSISPGTTVCFTGALKATIDGYAVTREQAHEFARGAGLVVLDSVTKKLEVLVVADPQSASGKAKKARSYGTRIIAEAVFWQLIGIPVD